METHIVKFRAKFDTKKYDEMNLRALAESKMKEIDHSLHPDLELFSVENDVVDVWIFTSFIIRPETLLEQATIGAGNHVTEPGIFPEEIIVAAVRDLGCGEPFKEVKATLKK